MKQFDGFMHGVNLGGWFSQCDYSEERYNNFITQKDFEVIKSWGLDHIRLPIDYNLVETKDGQPLEAGYNRIQNAIDWCKANKLNMILDLHKTAGYSFDQAHNEAGFFDSEPLQERFYKLWEQGHNMIIHIITYNLQTALLLPLTEAVTKSVLNF